jgi:hypothetical protein
MSIDFEHLSSESREEAHLSSEERIRRIQAERWIGYALAEIVLDRLDELLGMSPSIGRSTASRSSERFVPSVFPVIFEMAGVNMVGSNGTVPSSRYAQSIEHQWFPAHLHTPTKEKHARFVPLQELCRLR